MKDLIWVLRLISLCSFFLIKNCVSKIAAISKWFKLIAIIWIGNEINNEQEEKMKLAHSKITKLKQLETHVVSIYMKKENNKNQLFASKSSKSFQMISAISRLLIVSGSGVLFAQCQKQTTCKNIQFQTEMKAKVWTQCNKWNFAKTHTPHRKKLI